MKKITILFVLVALMATVCVNAQKTVTLDAGATYQFTQADAANTSVSAHDQIYVKNGGEIYVEALGTTTGEIWYKGGGTIATNTQTITTSGPESYSLIPNETDWFGKIMWIIDLSVSGSYTSSAGTVSNDTVYLPNGTTSTTITVSDQIYTNFSYMGVWWEKVGESGGPWEGKSYTVTTGVWSIYAADAAINDSYDTLVIIELPPVCSPTPVSHTLTGCGSVTWNSQTYTTSGTKTQNFGCDSVVTLYVTVDAMPTSLSIIGPDSLTVGDAPQLYSSSATGAASYAWTVDGISQGADQTVTIDPIDVDTITLAVTATNGTCTTSALQKIVVIGKLTGTVDIFSADHQAEIKVYSAYNNIIISSSEPIGDIVVLNMLGAVMYNGSSADNTYTIPTSGFQKGLYIIVVGNKSHKILVH